MHEAESMNMQSIKNLNDPFSPAVVQKWTLCQKRPLRFLKESILTEI